MTEDELVDEMQDVMEWFARFPELTPPTDRQLAAAMRQARLYRVTATKRPFRIPMWMDAVIFILFARRMAAGAIARRLGLSPNTVSSRTHPTRRMELVSACRRRRERQWRERQEGTDGAHT